MLLKAGRQMRPKETATGVGVLAWRSKVPLRPPPRRSSRPSNAFPALLNVSLHNALRQALLACSVSCRTDEEAYKIQVNNVDTHYSC